LSDDDIAGAMRDVASDPVRKVGTGEPYDHLQEVDTAVASLRNAQSAIMRFRIAMLKREIPPKEVAARVNPALDAVKRTLSVLKIALEKVKK
jgi:hypothetical protein